MHTNLKLINPLKENELFSIHKYQKMALSNKNSNSYFNAIYRPFNTKKNSFITLNKNKKLCSTLTKIKPKNKINYNLKQNILSHIPYPSFPNNNNKIPAIFKNTYKITKYPKINNNFTVTNFHDKKNKDNNIKDILLNNNSNSTIHNTYKIIKGYKNSQNRTYGGDLKFFNFDQIFNDNKKSENHKNIRNEIFNYEKNKIKKFEKKSKIKLNINTFNNTLFNNFMRLIEIRDQNNNSLLYTKVTNLLLDEINKLIELQRISNEKKNKGTMTYTKIKFKKRRKLKLEDYDDISFIKKKTKKRQSLQISSIDLKYQEKFGFNLKAEDSSLLGDAKSELSDLSDSFGGGGNIYANFYKNQQYKNEYGQTIENFYKTNNKNFYKDYDRLNNKNENISTNNNIYNDNNYIKNEGEKKDNMNNINNNSNNIIDSNFHGNSIFNNFIQDSRKKNERRAKNRNNQEKSSFSNYEKIDFSTMLNSIVSKIEKKPLNDNLGINKLSFKAVNKIEENIKKENSVDSVDNDIPIFEQMIRNDKLIRLIHNYMKHHKIENEENEEEEESKEEKKEKEKKEREEKEKEEKEREEKEEKEREEKEKKEREKIIMKEKRKKEKIKMITEYYKENLVKNKANKRKKIRAKTPILPKIELGIEIIKHICDEIEINKNDKDIIVKCVSNVLEIASRDNKTKKEDELQKKLIKPLDEIIKKYLENMQKINLSRHRPNSLFNNPIKSFLRERLKEILNIADDYNQIEREEEEIKKKEQIARKKKIKELQRIKKVRKLIFDNSYFFKKDGKKSRKGSLNILNLSINKEEDQEASFSSIDNYQENKINKSIHIKKSSK